MVLLLVWKKKLQSPQGLSALRRLKDLVDEILFEPPASSLRKQKLKLDGAKLDEKDEDAEKSPTNSGLRR